MEWSNFFFGLLDKIFETKVINRIERVGLRYINVFTHKILEKIKCNIDINGRVITDESTNLRTQITDDDYTLVLQIGNAISMVRQNKPVDCSVIDIDVLHNVKDTHAFLKHYREIIDKAHLKEKELFFSLLNESFLEEFNPFYGE